MSGNLRSLATAPTGALAEAVNHLCVNSVEALGLWPKKDIGDQV